MSDEDDFDSDEELLAVLTEIIQTTPPSKILMLLAQAAKDIGIPETSDLIQECSEQINDTEWEESGDELA